jgi:fatty acid desaturase
MTDPATFHKLAKEAGNRLSAYVNNFALGAVGVLFLAATQDGAARWAWWPRVWLLAALALAAVTVGLRLLELHVDARRFYEVAQQEARPKGMQDWARNERLKALRVRLIFASYWTFGAALACMVGAMGMRLLG